MRELTDKNFGIAIAYLIPGFVVLWGAAYLSPTVQGWLRPTCDGGEATIGSFLFVLLSSLAAGLTISALRWATIDTLHHATGVSRPQLDFSALATKLESFGRIVEDNYRYYQFYANMAVALPIAGICRVSALGFSGNGYLCLAALATEGVLLAGSRDSLVRYYSRVHTILGAQSALSKFPEDY